MTDARGGRLLRSFVSAPLTFAWLAILFITTRRQKRAGQKGSRRLQRRHSTNIHGLRSEPLRVLATSLFWLDGRQWWPYVPVFAALVAPAERRLRWWRWLLIGIVAHVVGTYRGQDHLRRRILSGDAPRRLVAARDVGVSYFVLGVAGTLSGYIPRSYRSHCQATGFAALLINAIVRPTHTEVGHLTSFIVGLAAIPLAPDRDELAYPTSAAVGLG